MDWRSEMMAVPPDPLYDAAFRIWCRYYVDTQTFDRAVCSGRSQRTGDAIPATAEQRALCGRNARRVHEEAGRALAALGCPREISGAAKDEASRMTLEGQRAVLAQRTE